MLFLRGSGAKEGLKPHLRVPEGQRINSVCMLYRWMSKLGWAMALWWMALLAILEPLRSLCPPPRYCLDTSYCVHCMSLYPCDKVAARAAWHALLKFDQVSDLAQIATWPTVAEDACCVRQGHVSGALPPPTYGRSGPLSLSQTLFVPPDQTPYTPSSFSGLDSVPSPPVPFQPPSSPGQNLSSGQAPAPTPLSGPHPLRNPGLPSTLIPKGPLPKATRGASPGTLQQSQHSPDPTGSWGTLGGENTVSTGAAPPVNDPVGFLGRHRSDSTANLAAQQGSGLILPAANQNNETPKEPPYLTRPGQITFESSSAVSAVAPIFLDLAPKRLPQGRFAPASQPVAGIRTAYETEGAPSSVLLRPGSPFPASSNPAEQKYPDSALAEAGNALHGFLTTQDIVISGAPQAPSQTNLMPMHSLAFMNR